MMDELRKEFNENCILEVILEEPIPWIFKKSFYLIRLALLIFILNFLSYNISSLLFGYGLNFNLIDMLNYGNEYELFSVFRTILMVLMSIFAILILSNYYINRVATIYNKKYNDLMQMYLLMHDLESLNSNFCDFLFDFKNRFTHCIRFVKFVLIQNRLKYENVYLRKKGKKYIDDIIKYNNQDIQELENKMNKNPIFTFYVFIGGLIANNIIGFVFKTIESLESINIEIRIVVTGFIIISIMLVGQYIVKIFNFINIDIINRNSKRECEYLKEFNKYLINIVLKY